MANWNVKGVKGGGSSNVLLYHFEIWLQEVKTSEKPQNTWPHGRIRTECLLNAVQQTTAEMTFLFDEISVGTGEMEVKWKSTWPVPCPYGGNNEISVTWTTRSSSNDELLINLMILGCCCDRLCDLVVRVPDYRSRRPGFDSRRYQIFWEVVVGLAILGGSLVNTAWRVLRLRMDETPSSYGGQLRIYWISSRGQPTRGDPLILGVGRGANNSP
jgi:hypothetical protein